MGSSMGRAPSNMQMGIGIKASSLMGCLKAMGSTRRLMDRFLKVISSRGPGMATDSGEA